MSDAVSNPPAGGDQSQASTNDDNQNEVLKTAPWLVVFSAHGQVGVVGRFATEAEANAEADARRAGAVPASTEVTVRREADLPELVAEVEAAEFGLADEEDSAPSEPKPAKSARSSRK